MAVLQRSLVVSYVVGYFTKVIGSDVSGWQCYRVIGSVIFGW